MISPSTVSPLPTGATRGFEVHGQKQAHCTRLPPPGERLARCGFLLQHLSYRATPGSSDGLSNRLSPLGDRACLFHRQLALGPSTSAPRGQPSPPASPTEKGKSSTGIHVPLPFTAYSRLLQIQRNMHPGTSQNALHQPRAQTRGKHRHGKKGFLGTSVQKGSPGRRTSSAKLANLASLP